MGAGGNSFGAHGASAQTTRRPSPGQAGHFDAAAEHYDRFMGRYTATLAAAFADAAGVTSRSGTDSPSGIRVLDVGCGPGGLTTELGRRLGAESVAAVDPASQFVAACRARNPGTDVREGTAEQLPWPDGEFDAALSCLVIGFMADPDRGVREMARVTRPGGIVAACMWDIASGGMTMLRIFWDAVRQDKPDVEGERRLAGTLEGDIVARFQRAGLADVTGSQIAASVDYADFDDFWDPFTLAVGPAGRYLASRPAAEQARIREACRAQLPAGSFSLPARAWSARGTVTTE
jgi:SAM-dependent methyltransferase